LDTSVIIDGRVADISQTGCAETEVVAMPFPDAISIVLNRELIYGSLMLSLLLVAQSGLTA
jgi:hypothetical protein